MLNGSDVGGNTRAFQPNAEISKNGLAFGFWGSFAVNNVNANEMDWYVSYAINDLISVQFMDVFFPNDTLASNRYFNFDANGGTRHNFNVTINFGGTADMPIGIHADTYVYGSMDKDGKNKNRYSSYFEVNYKLDYKKTSITPFIGITPAASFWGNEFGVVNTGASPSKKVQITDKYALPISTRLVINPQTENIFFVCGIQL